MEDSDTKEWNSVHSVKIGFQLLIHDTITFAITPAFQYITMHPLNHASNTHDALQSIAEENTTTKNVRD